MSDYTPEQLTALRSEIQTDPVALGYSGKTHEQIAELLRKPMRQANREILTGGMIASSLVLAEFEALTADRTLYVQSLCSAGTIPVTPTLTAALGAVFGAGTTTRANLIALLKRSGSRAEELNLPSPTTSDVALALQ